MRPLSVVLVSTFVLGCGASAALPDESEDLGTSGGVAMAPRIVDMPVGLAGTDWRFVSATCTEGEPRLEGYAATAHVDQDGESLLVTYDHTWTNGCVQTTLQRVSPPPQPGELVIEEVGRVAVPPTPECFGQPEPPRPGEVRRNGRNLEVLVQRVRACGGFEITLVFEPALPSLLTSEQLGRRFLAHVGRGDATRVAELFSPAGVVLENFTVTETGDPFRHEGRDAVTTYFRDMFAGTPWRAARATRFEAGETPQQSVLVWEYFDPRLGQALSVRSAFTIAAGEIYEARLNLEGPPVVAGAAAPAVTAQ